MGDYIGHFRLAVVNAGSWMATIASVALVKDLMQIICLVASLAVSLTSIWWIRKQAAALDKRNKE